MFLALRRIHVFASDFSRSRRFYGETLALPEAGGFESDWVEFALGPLLLKLTPLRPGEVPARNQVAAVFSTASIDETIARLKERGVTVTRPPAEEFTGRSAEILDPDGYRIILFQASDLHPDEEWVPSSGVDELVKQKLHARRKREQARGTGKKPAKKAASAKKAPAKKAPAKKAASKKAPKKTAKKPAKKPAKKKKPARRR
ncbi:MAG TPA: VOC family protein [Thermoanaerobaculia bacterium]|nr:VOC family protein [Thermoanaerobaculia bacterium]